jgi:outer membrane lipopolysaccharide assembly protein LptE/RlpB
MNKNLLKWLPVLAALALLNGCAGYQLGSMLPPDIQKVYVPTFVNQTTEPFIEIETTQATIVEFQLDGSLEVVREEQADSILEVTLKDYNLEAVGYSKVRRTQANEYRVTITASILFKRKATDEVVVNYPAVIGQETFPYSGDLSSAKRAVLPQVAEQLAHNIVKRVVETW